MPCHVFRKELVSDVDMMIYIEDSVNQQKKSNQNQSNMLSQLLKK